MKKAKLNIAVIGYGYWGPNLVRNFLSLDKVKMISVCDTKKRQLDKCIQTYPWIKTTTSYQEILANKSIEAIAIATPVNTHYNLTLAALQAGKHVLVEKPLCTTVKEGKRLIDRAKQNKLVLMVGHTYIFTTAVNKLKELLQKRSLGRLFYYDSVRASLGIYRSDVNVIWDLAIHDLAILDFLLNKRPLTVMAIGFSHFRHLEDIAYLILDYKLNFSAHLHVNWLAPVKIRSTIICGSKKMVLFDDVTPSEKIKIYDRSVKIGWHKETALTPIYRHGNVVIPHLEQVEALRLECQHFLDCIRESKQPITDGYAGLRVVEILQAAQQSLKLGGRKVRINP